MKLWIDNAEKTLSGHTPLASSMDIVDRQKRDIEVLLFAYAFEYMGNIHH